MDVTQPFSIFVDAFVFFVIRKARRHPNDEPFSTFVDAFVFFVIRKACRHPNESLE